MMYVETKMQLLLSYLSYLIYYFMPEARGASAMLERLKSIEKTVGDQADKVVSQAQTAEPDPEMRDFGEETEDSEVVEEEMKPAAKVSKADFVEPLGSTYAGVESVSLHAVAEVGDLVHTRSNLADTLNSVGEVASDRKSRAGRDDDVKVRQGMSMKDIRAGRVERATVTGGTLDDAEVREADSTAKAQAVIPDEERAVKRRKGAFKGRKGAVKRRKGAFKGRKGAVKGRKGAVKGRKGAVKGRKGAVKRRKGAVKRRKGAVKRRKGAVKRRKGAVKRHPSLADIGIPKPLLPVANKPLYSYAVQALTASPLVSRVVLIGWTEHADALRSSVSEYKDLFNGVEVSVEGVPAEASAAEALMLVLERQADLKGKSLLVGYGDYMGAWPTRSTQSAAEVEVSMARVKDVPEDFVYTAYGTVEKTIVVLKSAEAVAFDGSLSLGLSKVFAEGDVTLMRNLVDSGCYYMGGNALERLREFMADDDEVDRNLRDGFVPWMVDKGYMVLLNGPSESPSVDPCKSRVKGTESLLHFNQQKLKHDRSTVKGVLYGSSSTVEEGTVVKNTVLGNSVRIADKCRVTKSVVMDGVEIDSGSTVQECVLAEGCEIGSNVKLSKCIVAKGVKVLRSGEYEEEDFDHDDIRFTNTHGVASCGQWWWRDKGHVSEASSNAVILAVMRERLEKSLRDKEKMRQRMELLEDELALCKVKKRSYRADGKRLKAEVDTLRARAACLGEESSSNVEEVRYWQKTAKEANKHLTE
ncbi:translation initiation factor eif-2b gamma subunit, putative [Perkinsus marinus ATCC 50983]|uniref:Translation initiation factor eIF2B subunit gamma n=1 Tax=Perkinsus marinus (strain ATCC 50983 / TXsc) TaxID=423536 RepID=C5L719_PERM5|nr:translation initiation factor eif-2b gamma subunit, putative [Perkinsus marinus ATCC 50983]EER07281.1 translation initiation factor eif-2b gamma subunit, putative [Perkinsus marinus ATCC 50983]|eukprot:XP_002775465.1 translation initiation factor eif-2b gamma subunit, putative [Perkinsus marinus ATCC 50983]